MNKNIKIAITGIMASLFITGCAQKVRVKVLQPAEIARAAETKKIAITNFKRDKVNLSGKIEAKIAKHMLDGKQYFTTLSREDMKKILKEQRLQNSGLIDRRTAVKVGKLMGAQAIISGSVGKPTATDTRFYETRRKCNDNSCWDVKVNCVKRLAGLSSEIRMIDTQKGDIIYADTINKTAEYKHCNDDSKALPSTEMASASIADAIGNEFVYKLVPHYVYYNVELLDSPDLEYTDQQKLTLEGALGFIKQNRFDRGEELLSRLIESTGEKSYVPIYNLGVIREAQGKFKEAKALYTKADALTIQPVSQINEAINKIDQIMEQHKKAVDQIKKKS